MSDDPQQPHDEAITQDDGFELFGRWFRVSLAAFDHIGLGGTPEGVVGSARARAVYGTIGESMVVRPARRRAPMLLILSSMLFMLFMPVVLALITGGAEDGDAARAGMRARLSLRYDTSVLEPEHGARLQREWSERLEPMLARADGRILQIRVVAFDEDLHDYEIRLELSDGAHTRRSPSLLCDGCSEARLVEFVTERAQQLLTPTS